MESKTIKTAFPYPGCKRRLLSDILPHVPAHRIYVEVFAGSAALLLAKEPSAHEVINDINGDLVAFFRYVKFHAPALMAELEGWPNARENFLSIKASTPLTELQRAARWYFLQTCSFGGKGEAFGRARDRYHGFDAARHGALVAALSARLRKVVVENQDWEEIVSFYDTPDTFFFFDPPYLGCSKTAYNAWDAQTMWRLAGAVRRLQGKYLLTVNDSAQTREIFAGIPCREMSIRYSLASNRSGKVSGELLIGNCLTAAAGRRAA